MTTLTSPPFRVSALLYRINALGRRFGLGQWTWPEQVGAVCVPQDALCQLLRGDNLDALCALYAGDIQFKAIYIDPPYNTGKQFIYNDRFATAEGLFGNHTGWLQFMLPRLCLAQALLQPDGVLFVSIDDHEQAYLRLLLDAVFEEANFISQFVVKRSKNGRGSQKNVALSHDYVLCYGKSADAGLRGFVEQQASIATYDQQDEHGRFRVDGMFRKKGDASRREDRPNMYYPLYFAQSGQVWIDPGPGRSEIYPKDTAGVERRWLWESETARVRIHELFAGPSGTVYVKNYHHEGKRIKARSVLDSPAYYTECATKEIKVLYGDKLFETPKPVQLISDLLDLVEMRSGEAVLDFFAGTGTTAEAVCQLNGLDGRDRRVVLVESRSRIHPLHVAYQHGYRMISDLTEARLRRLNDRDQWPYVAQDV